MLEAFRSSGLSVGIDKIICIVHTLPLNLQIELLDGCASKLQDISTLEPDRQEKILRFKAKN